MKVVPYFIYLYLGFYGTLLCAADVSTHSFAGCAFPDTNQAICYDSSGGVIACPAPGNSLAQDGSYASSVSTMSFTIYNGVDWGGTATSSVTVDNRTGLMWVHRTADAGISGTHTWLNALAACEGLPYAGFSDWRLPNARELLSLVDYVVDAEPKINTTYFPGTVSNYYWTSTTSGSSYAWRMNFTTGMLGNYSKTGNYYVRCVRAGPP